MAHIRRNPSQRSKTSIRKRQKRRMTIGLMIIVVFFVSIIVSIVFVIVSTP